MKRVSRLDEIKSRLETSQKLTSKEYPSYWAKDDVPYLLEIIEQYQAVHKTIKDMLWSRHSITRHEENTDYENGQMNGWFDAGDIVDHVFKEAAMTKEERRMDAIERYLAGPPAPGYGTNETEAVSGHRGDNIE